MGELAWVDGEFTDLADATVSIRDRGFLFGDGVYEVVRLLAEGYFRLDSHLDRLIRSARALDFESVPDRDNLRTRARELARRSDLEAGKLYIQVTRGAGPRRASFPEAPSPTVVMYVDETRRGADRLREEGASVLVVPEMRWSRCDIKSVNLLPKVLMKERAKRDGCYEALFVSDGGVVWEGTSTNVFAVRDGVLRTTGHRRRVLQGVTRRVVVELAEERGLPVELGELRLEELQGAEEVFLTGTLTGVLGVTEVDGRLVAGGEVGPYTERLHEGLLDVMRDETRG